MWKGMRDREAGIGRDSSGHRLNESERHRNKKKQMVDVQKEVFCFFLVDVGLDEV